MTFHKVIFFNLATQKKPRGIKDSYQSQTLSHMNLMDVVMLQGVKSQYHGVILYISNGVITISWACHFYLLEYVIVVVFSLG